MTRRVSVLVVASATAASPQLIEALQARAKRGPVRATLLMPCGGVGRAAREAAAAEIETRLARWREAGLGDQELDGIVGDQDPLVAVHETWDPLRFDEIIVSTLPEHASDWVRWDLPHRIARLTDARVTHVVARKARDVVRSEPAPVRERPPLGPLSVLLWGHPQDETDDERQRRLRASRR